MKKIFFVCLIFYFTNISLNSQNFLFDSIIDRFGTKEPIVDLMLHAPFGSGLTLKRPAPTVSCTAGYFNLYFAPGSVFTGTNGAAFQNVLCNVFGDISNFINSPLSSPTNTTKVNVYCDQFPLSTPALASASPYHLYPLNPASPFPGIDLNAVQKTILSGVDAYNGVTSGNFNLPNNFYHTQIRIGANFNWNLNLATLTIANNEYDLYTVALHEVMHALGFYSLIGPSGVSLFGSLNNYYSKYDTYLHNSSSLPLLTSPTSSCVNYNYAFMGSNTQINPLNCTSSSVSDITNCSNAARYISSNVNSAIYTPNCFETGSSLSHFEDLCNVPASFSSICSASTIPLGSNNNLYFLMCNANNTGNCYIKRRPVEEERYVLCDLGYSVNNSYSSIALGANITYTGGNCSNLSVWGVNDGLSATGNPTIIMTSSCITIPKSLLSVNDVANSSVTCPSFVYSYSGLILSETASDILICNTTTTNYCGNILIKYIPKDISSSNYGNVTYVTVFAPCTNCNVNNSCEIVSNGDFESIPSNTTCAGMNNWTTYVPCWKNYHGSCDLYDRFCNVSAGSLQVGNPACGNCTNLNSKETHNGTPNDRHMGQLIVINNNTSTSEVYANSLNSPLIPGVSYKLSFWSAIKTAPLNLFPGQFVYSFATLQNLNSVFSVIGNPSLGTQNTILSFTMNYVPEVWSLNTGTFTFNSSGSLPHNALLMGPNDIANNFMNNHPFTATSNLLFDDVNIIPLSNQPFQLPSSVCTSNSYTDLSQYVAPVNPTFSGIGVTNNAGVFAFNNPPTLPLGIYPITCTYTNSIGCVITDFDNAYVSGITTNTNATTCSSGNYTLNATAFAPGTTFNWQPGGATTSSIAVNVTNTTIFTLTASNGSCTAQYTTAINIPTLSISPVPPVCINSSSGFLQTYLSAVTPTTGAFLGPNLINGNCGGNICSYIDLAITPQPAPGVYTYSYVVPTNTSIGIFCTKTITFNVTYLPPFTTSISALPTGTNCFTSGQTYTLVANPNPLGSINYTWFPGGNTTSSIVITPTNNVVYTVFTDNGFCSASATLAVNPNPPITFTNLPTNWCTYQTYYMEDYLAAGTPTGGTWSGTNMGTFYQNQIFGGTNIDVNPVLTSLGTQTVTYCYTSPTNSLCNVCNQFTVNINQGFQLNASGPAVFCANISTLQTNIGVAVTFTGTGNPFPISYSWTPSGLTTASINVTPAVNTTYTCIATSVAGCTAINTVSVSVSNSCCISNNYISGSTIGAPGATTTINGFYALNQNVTLDGLVYLSGEFAIAPNVKITVAPNATLQTAGIADAPGLHLYACSDMWTGIEITNTGKLFMNTGGDLIEDALIAVYSNNSTTTNTLTPDIVIRGAAFNRNRIGVRIENFTQATNPAPFIIENTVFTCRDLLVPIGTGTWPFAINLNAPSGTTLALSSPYLIGGFPVTNLKAPFATQQSSIGVWVDNSGVTLNPTTPAPIYYNVIVGRDNAPDDYNIFDNQMFGIYSRNSNVVSVNNVFQNSKRVLIGIVKAQVRGGYGIYSINDYSQIGNGTTYLSLVSITPSLQALTNNKFYNNPIGVGAYNTFELKAENAYFASSITAGSPVGALSNGQYAIHCTGNMFKNYSIKNNRFINHSTGIYFYLLTNPLNIPGVINNYGQYLGKTEIQNNLFSPSTSTTGAVGTRYLGTAVEVNSALSPFFFTVFESTSAMQIKQNILSRVYRGISVANNMVPSYTITAVNNSITMIPDVNPLNTQYGIKLDNNTGSAANTNIISGNAAMFNNTFASGVYFGLNNTNCGVLCNTVSTVYNGFNFNSTNNGTGWRNNLMSNNQRGLALNNAGVIGQQGNFNTPSDNRWVGTWNNTNRFGTFTDGSSFPFTSPLFIRTLANYNSPSNTNQFLLPTQIYGFGNGLNPVNNSAGFVSCTAASGGGGGGSGGGSASAQREALLTDLATDNITFTVNVSESQEIAKNQVFADITREPALAASNSTLSNFYAINNALTRGIYKNIESNLVQNNLTAAAILLAAFSPSTNIEANYKLFYTLQKNYMALGTLTALENLQLLVLAHQCPFTDGAVVYNARSLYGLINMVSIDYNDAYCAQLGFSFKTNNSDSIGNSVISDQLYTELIRNEKVSKETFKNKTNYFLFPNPAKDELFINSTNMESESVELEISDANAKLLVRQVVSINNYLGKIFLNLVNGIYTVKITTKQGNYEYKKLIISR